MTIPTFEYLHKHIMHSFLVYKSLATALEGRLFGSLIEHWYSDQGVLDSTPARVKLSSAVPNSFVMAFIS